MRNLGIGGDLSSKRERRNTGAAFLLAIEVLKNLLGGLRLLGEHQLQMVAESSLDCDHELVWNADLVRQRAKNMLRLLERSQGPGAESLVLSLQLIQHVQARPFARLLFEHLVLLGGGAVHLVVDFL